MKQAQILTLALILGSLGGALLVHAGQGANPEYGRIEGLGGSRDPGRSPGFAAEVRREALEAMESKAPREGYYWARPGSRFIYSLHSQIRTRLTSQGLMAQDLVYTAEGKLEVRIADRRDDEILCRIRCPELALRTTASGAAPMTHATLGHALSRTSFVKIRQDGRVLGLAFAAGMPAEARVWLRSFVAKMQFQIPGENEQQPSWELEEDDATGLARVRYAWTATPGNGNEARLSKELMGYVRIPGLAGTSIHPRAKAWGMASFERSTGWLHSAKSRDEYEIETEESKTKVHISGEFEIACVSKSVATQHLQGDWCTSWQGLHGQEDAAELTAKITEPRELPEDLGPLGLVRDILALTATGDQASEELTLAREKLAMLIRSQPKALEEVGQFITPDLPEPSLAILLNTIGAADVPAAQAFLRGAMGDSTRRRETRLYSALSLFQIQKPKPETLEMLDRVAGEEGPREVSSTSLLLLGAFAREGKFAGKSLDLLLAHESRVQGGSSLITWLEALGNAASPRANEALRRYADHPDASVRSIASKLGAPTARKRR